MSDDEYIWIDVGPGRKRQYKLSDLKARPIKYGQAPYVRGDTIDPVPGPDGRMYDSRSAWEAAAEKNNCYTYSKQELREHLASVKADKAIKVKQREQKIKDTVVEIANDMDLSNKL